MHNIISRRKGFFVFIALSLALPRADGEEPLRLVENKSSAYRIYHAAGAPSSVKEAALELQRVVRISTGAELPIMHEAASPMIALGDSGAARSASWATLFGVYAFLEQVVGVRWLMPGEWGEDIPRHDRLDVPPLDVKDAPLFFSRTVDYVQGRKNKEVQRWKLRNKVQTCYWISFGHAFDTYPPVSVLSEHPEYMAMRDNGTRQPVPSAKHKGHKYCLTDPGLIEAYGRAIIKNFDRAPTRQHASMSPSDGAGFCQCPRCKKILEEDDKGQWGNFAERGWSCTPSVVHFYNGVARVVARKYPDRIVGGLIYHAYTYPPGEVVPVEPNVILNIAVLDHYGFKLYKPERAAEFRKLYPAWSKFTSRLAHTDYSTWMRDWYGLPLPPGRPILKMLFPAFKAHRLFFVHYTGQAAWGTGGLHNYMVARLLWRPDEDVDKVYWEFLTRAYGPEAAKSIDRIYDISERALAEYVRSHPGLRQPSYDVSYEFVKSAYAPHFAEFESLYRDALGKVQTEAQRKRLEMLGDNLTLLHYNLRCAGLADKAEQSMCYKSQEEFQRFVKDRSDSLALGYHAKPQPGKPLKILFAPEGRVVKIPFLPDNVPAPTLDGDLSDAAWRHAAPVSAFRRRGTLLPAERQTTVRFLFDTAALYLAVECLDDNMKAVPHACRDNDSTSIFSDDTFEVFFAPRKNYWSRYRQIAFNAAGAHYDAMVHDKSIDVRFESAARMNDSSWTLEIAIPFAPLGYDGPPFGVTWRGNLCRIRRANGREVSSWAAVEEGFHEPKSFGYWEFAAE
jgi:hypothetical protein